MPLDDQSELFYWVDENDKVLGSVLRSRAHKNKEIIHRSVFLVIVDSKNRVLLQKRSKNKDILPEYWTVSVSGHVSYGDSYKQAVVREMKEELGVRLKPSLVMKKLFVTKEEQEYSAVYKAKYNGEKILFDKTEVSKIKWVRVKGLLGFIKKNKLTPSALKVLVLMGWVEKEKLI